MSNSNLTNQSFCSHPKLKQKYPKGKPLKTYDFCEKCGLIILKYENQKYFTTKPNKYKKPIDLNPIELILKMKNQQEIFYPCLNYNFNIKIDKNEICENINLINNKLNFYVSKRRFLMYHLQNLTKLLNYSDSSFYQTLAFLDIYLCHNIYDEMSDSELLGLLIAFFSISSKYKETDIFEPNLRLYCEYSENFEFSIIELRNLENLCLNLINYNFFLYSAYDWLCAFTAVGYIFECEIDNEEMVDLIHGNCLKLLVLITPQNIFIKYSPMKLALAIIKINRENYISPSKINNNLYENLLKLFNIKFTYYEECYNEIKLIIEKESNTSPSQTETDSNNTNTRKTPFLTNTNKTKSDANKGMKPKIQNYSQDKLVIKTERINKFKIKELSDIKNTHPKSIESFNNGKNKKIINNNQINNITINVINNNSNNKYNNLHSQNSKIKIENKIVLNYNQNKNSFEYLKKIGKFYKYNINFLKQKKLFFNFNSNLKVNDFAGSKLILKDSSFKLKKQLLSNNIKEGSHKRLPRNANLNNLNIQNSNIFFTEDNNNNDQEIIVKNKSTNNLEDKINNSKKISNTINNIQNNNLNFIDERLLKRQKTLDNIQNDSLEPINFRFYSKDKIIKKNDEIKYFLDKKNNGRLNLSKKKYNFSKVKNNKSNINELLSYQKFIISTNKKLPHLRLKTNEK